MVLSHVWKRNNLVEGIQMPVFSEARVSVGRLLDITGLWYLLYEGGPRDLKLVARRVVDEQRTIHVGEPVHSARLITNPNGTFIVLATWNGCIDIIPIAQPRDVKKHMTGVGRVLATAFSPDGELIALAGEETLEVWDLWKGERVFSASAKKAGDKLDLRFVDGDTLIMSNHLTTTIFA